MKIIKKSVLLACVMMLAIPYEVSAAELFGTIWYKGKPLSTAEITVKDQRVKTNDKGYYSVNLDPGPYTLGIKLPDGGIREEKVDVFPQDTEKNLKLE